jgi:hypothetical protein
MVRWSEPARGGIRMLTRARLVREETSELIALTQVMTYSEHEL